MISLCVPVYRDSESRGRRGEDGMWKMKESLYFPIFGYLISLTGIFFYSQVFSLLLRLLLFLLFHCFITSYSTHWYIVLHVCGFPGNRKERIRWISEMPAEKTVLPSYLTFTPSGKSLRWAALNLCTFMYFSCQLITPKALCKSTCMYFVAGKAETEFHWWNLKSNSPLTPRPPSSSPHNSELSQGGNEGGSQWPRAGFEPSLNSSLWRSWVTAFCFHSVGPVKSICSNKLVTTT